MRTASGNSNRTGATGRSTSARPASVDWVRAGCKDYLPTQYSTTIPFGSLHPTGWRSEDIEKQTFADESFDIVITQDVFEHLFHPGAAAREIARTLRPGGLCL